jgi:hypothetical protein
MKLKWYIPVIIAFIINIGAGTYVSLNWIDNNSTLFFIMFVIGFLINLELYYFATVHFYAEHPEKKPFRYFDKKVQSGFWSLCSILIWGAMHEIIKYYTDILTIIISLVGGIGVIYGIYGWMKLNHEYAKIVIGSDKVLSLSESMKYDDKQEKLAKRKARLKRLKKLKR